MSKTSLEEIIIHLIEANGIVISEKALFDLVRRKLILENLEMFPLNYCQLSLALKSLVNARRIIIYGEENDIKIRLSFVPQNGYFRIKGQVYWKKC